MSSSTKIRWSTSSTPSLARKGARLRVVAMSSSEGTTRSGSRKKCPENQVSTRKTSASGHFIASDADFVMALIEEQHVVTVQGAAYGMSPYFRLSYATSMERLQTGCDRLAPFPAQQG